MELLFLMDSGTISNKMLHEKKQLAFFVQLWDTPNILPILHHINPVYTKG